MKCPHCGYGGKAPVTETREAIDATYRRRTCPVCEKAFVTYELAPAGLKMPAQHNNRRRRKHEPKPAQEIRSTGAHLQGIW